MIRASRTGQAGSGGSSRPPGGPTESMTANQLFQAVAPELRGEIITYMQSEQRAAYRALIQNLAAARKLRPVFVMEKNRTAQAEWLLAQLRLRQNDEVTVQILQIWLLKGQAKMLVTFLDAVGINHNGEGEVEDLPEDVPQDKAEAGIEALLKDNPPARVALYLHMFQKQKEDGFPGLTAALAARPELQLAAES
jgi:hypothetical protein